MNAKSKHSVAARPRRDRAKALLAVGALALAPTLLAACGQKGPLTLPPSAAASAPGGR